MSWTKLRCGTRRKTLLQVAFRDPHYLHRLYMQDLPPSGVPASEIKEVWCKARRTRLRGKGKPVHYASNPIAGGPQYVEVVAADEGRRVARRI